MNHSIRWIAATALFAVGLALVSAAPQVSAPSKRTAREAEGPTSPPWRQRQNLENGIALEAVVGFCKVLTDPETKDSVRPVSIRLSFMREVEVLTQVDYLDLQSASAATPIQFPAVGSSPIYAVTITPKHGQTWGTVEGVDHLDIVALPR